MNILRRSVLKGASASGVLAAALAAGLLKPTQVLAADWNKAAFESKEAAGAMKAMGADAAVASKDILVKAPDIAENGAVVPVDVVSNIPNTVSLMVFVDKNPFPLSVAFDFANGAVADVSMRLKMGNTSDVRVVAKTADGKLFVATKEVKVTAGGCGG